MFYKQTRFKTVTHKFRRLTLKQQANLERGDVEGHGSTEERQDHGFALSVDEDLQITNLGLARHLRVVLVRHH